MNRALQWIFVIALPTTVFAACAQGPKLRGTIEGLDQGRRSGRAQRRRALRAA